VRQATKAGLIADEMKRRNTVAVFAAVANGLQKATDTVAVAAEVAKSVILRHRGVIGSARGLAMDMLGELQLATHSQAELVSLLKLATEWVDAETAVLMQQSRRR
jgi:hypothetical protein